MTAIPTIYRRRFVTGSILAWSALAAMGCILSTGITLAAWLGMLYIQHRWESRLRKRYLPSEGQKNWVGRASIALCVMLGTGHLLIREYGSFIPGLLRYTTTGQIEMSWEAGEQPQHLDIHYKSTATSSGTLFPLSAKQHPETLTFQQAEKKSPVEWELKDGPVLVNQARTNTHPWTPEGLSRMTEDLYGGKIPVGDEALVASFYDKIASQQGFPLKSAGVMPFRNCSYSGSSHGTVSYTPVASLVIAIATTCLFGFCVHFTAKATMGTEMTAASPES